MTTPFLSENEGFFMSLDLARNMGYQLAVKTIFKELFEAIALENTRDLSYEVLKRVYAEQSKVKLSSTRIPGLEKI